MKKLVKLCNNKNSTFQICIVSIYYYYLFNGFYAISNMIFHPNIQWHTAAYLQNNFRKNFCLGNFINKI